MHITEILTPEGMATLLRTGTAFVDEVDSALTTVRAAGQHLPDRPLHGRLTHLVGMDYLGYFLRQRNVPPERLRETLQWVGQNQDLRGANGVWSYLLDQAPGPPGSRGLSTPDILHQQVSEACGLTH